MGRDTIIGWYRISKERAVLIILLWAMSVGLYMYNYYLGFIVLYFLSVLYVFLEFPLNYRTFIGIGKELRDLLFPSVIRQGDIS